MATNALADFLASDEGIEVQKILVEKQERIVILDQSPEAVMVRILWYMDGRGLRYHYEEFTQGMFCNPANFALHRPIDRHETADEFVQAVRRPAEAIVEIIRSRVLEIRLTS